MRCRGNLVIRSCDFKEGLSSLEDGSVDVVFTSPPYKTSEGFSWKLIDDLLWVVSRKLKDTGILYLNFGQLSEDPRRFLDVQDVPYFQLGPVICWVKSIPELGGQFRPLPGHRWLNRKWEPIYILHKGGYKLDREAIGVPYRDKSNIVRRGHSSDSQCPGDVWFHPYETVQCRTGHPYQMPKSLIRRALRLAGVGPDSLVVDPFAGSGVVIEVATELGAQALGFDTNPEYATEREGYRTSDTPVSSCGRSEGLEK